MGGFLSLAFVLWLVFSTQPVDFETASLFIHCLLDDMALVRCFELRLLLQLDDQILF